MSAIGNTIRNGRGRWNFPTRIRLRRIGNMYVLLDEGFRTREASDVEDETVGSVVYDLSEGRRPIV